MLKRRRFKQSTSFQERLAEWAKQVRDQADQLPPGTERDKLLKKVSQADTAAHLDDWANSPGLQPSTWRSCPVISSVSAMANRSEMRWARNFTTPLWSRYTALRRPRAPQEPDELAAEIAELAAQRDDAAGADIAA